MEQPGQVGEDVLDLTCCFTVEVEELVERGMHRAGGASLTCHRLVAWNLCLLIGSVPPRVPRGGVRITALSGLRDQLSVVWRTAAR